LELNKHIHIYFSGIGGIGMSALAAYFIAKGVKVSGYDRMPSAITDKLTNLGANIHFTEDISLVPENIDLVIYTPAIPADSIEMEYFKNKKIEILKRSEVLAQLTAVTFNIAIAGTHGKTSITSMLSYILKSADKKFDSFIGGISKNFSSNLIMSDNPELIIAEADEFDRSFLKLEPDIAVISSIDPDHLDIYGNYEELSRSFSLFAHKIRRNGKLIHKYGLNIKTENNIEKFTYSACESQSAADYHAFDITVKEGRHYFNLKLKDEIINNICPGVPGIHNIENVVAAAAVSHILGVKTQTIKEAITTYKGVERRFDFRIISENMVYVDDYAHHPAEITACLSSLKKLFPNKQLTTIFQPHLFTRTRDLTDDFANALGIADKVILLDIYPARELPIPGITSSLLLARIPKAEKILMMKEELIEYLRTNPPQLLVTMGAGDIDRLVAPIENELNRNLQYTPK